MTVAPEALATERTLSEVELAYACAREDALAAVEAATDALERCADLRTEYVTAHGYALKAGEEVPVRLMPLVLPGRTNAEALRVRFTQALARRW